MTRKREVRLSGGETIEQRAQRLAAFACAGWIAGNGDVRIKRATVEWRREQLMNFFVSGYMAAAQDWCGGKVRR